jgi:aromatic-L-amino-acid decarboxylase
MPQRKPSEPPPRDLAALDTTPEDLERLLGEVGRRLARFVAALASEPAQSADRYDPGAPWRRAPLPWSPSGLAETLDQIFDEVVPAAFNPASPGYLAYVPGGGLVSAAIADLIAATVNRYTGLWASAPAPVDLETQALAWLAEALGLPAATRGLLTSGASMSTLLAFVAAREKLLGEDLGRGTLYASREVHHSVTKAARVAGIPERNLRLIEVDERFRMRIDRLEQAIAEDRDRGLTPFLVCGSAGTVNTGAVDPFEAIARVAEQEGLWFHIDGAYGAAFGMVPELAPVLRGMERADSLAVDPHKGLFLAYGTGALFVRDLAGLRRAFSATGSYMPGLQDGEERIDFCEHSFELSRPWRGLRLWLPFKLHGLAAFREALRERRALAARAWEALAAEPDVEAAAPPELSLFAFRQRFAGAAREEENRRNRALLDRINAPRRVMLTGTEIDGVFWLRLCVLHLRTTAERVEEAVQLVREGLRSGR